MTTKFTFSVPIVKSRLFIALFLIVISNLGWLFPVCILPFLKMTLEQKAVWAGGSIVFGHITYNLGLVLAGGHVIHLIRARKQDVRLFWVQVKLFISSFFKYFPKKNTRGQKRR